MVEPMNTLTSRSHDALIFVGPAQSGKTDALIVNGVAYSVKVDPMDMIIYSPGMIEARDFSLRRIDRLHRHSPDIGMMLLQRADADNRLDKHYSSGVLLTLSHVSAGSLAGKPIPKVFITDRDRMDDNIDKEGEVFDLARKRTTTFGSFAMTVCESSPSREVTDLRWIPSTPHEAPPCEGIIKLYNRGDRRRWYWPCPHCSEYFEGMFKHLWWDSKIEGTNKDRAETVRMICPSCGVHIHPDDRQDMQLWGVWLKDGQGIDSTGQIVGPSPRTSIASFWLRGVAAAFIKWRDLVETYLDAMDEYRRTGSEEALRKFSNNDLGEPYKPQKIVELRVPEVLKSRAEKIGERKVPLGVRFLVATVDVQTNRFVVQVFGVLPGVPFDLAVIDRFDIRKSKRKDKDEDSLWVKPHTYSEDWDLITEEVLNREYELGDGSGRWMAIKFTACDSGGRAGATSNAYTYWRKLKSEGKAGRFILLKGDSAPNQPRTHVEFPDSQRKDMVAAARGDIPILMLNSNLLKDDLNGRLDCLEPGKGMIRFPDWMSDSFYSEYCVEIRTDKGWERPDRQPNESWDLTYYAIGLCISNYIRVEGLKWTNSPGWATDWEGEGVNDLVRASVEVPRFSKPVKSAPDFASLAKALA